MKRNTVWLIAAVLVAALPAHAAAPQVQWTKTFVGWGGARGYCVQQTSDGGYIAVGYTGSPDSTPREALLLVKLDAAGDSQWVRTFKAAGGVRGSSVLQTSDGGYVVAGRAINEARGHWKPCLIRTDAVGNEVWRSYLANKYSAGAYSVVGLGDTGYAVVVKRDLGDSAVILWRTDHLGNTRWFHTYNIRYNLDETIELSLRRTPDGGYIIGAKTLLKVDSLGAPQRNKTFGSVRNANSAIQIRDGGYVATGTTSDYSSIYLLKADANQGRVWLRTYMPSNWSRGHWVEQTTDGGYIIAGTSRDSNLHDKVTLVRTLPSGALSWGDTLFSGEGASVRQTTDGGYVVCGTSWTGPSLFVARLAAEKSRR